MIFGTDKSLDMNSVQECPDERFNFTIICNKCMYMYTTSPYYCICMYVLCVWYTFAYRNGNLMKSEQQSSQKIISCLRGDVYTYTHSTMYIHTQQCIYTTCIYIYTIYIMYGECCIAKGWSQHNDRNVVCVCLTILCSSNTSTDRVHSSGITCTHT